MEPFPHLRFVQKIAGKPRLPGGGKRARKSNEHRENRRRHSNNLGSSTNKIKTTWAESLADREEGQLAPLDESIVPIFLQINPALLTSDFDLAKFGIEIISEEEDGFIVGASLDNLQSLEEKIKGFIDKEHSTGKIADFWEIIDGNRDVWKPKHILSEALWTKWNTIHDDTLYQLEVGIAFDKPIGKEPDPTKKGGETRLENYRRLQEQRDDLLMERENHFETFIRHYGEITSSLEHLSDSFGCTVEITGKGLKDLVVNYPFVFEVAEVEEIKGVTEEVEAGFDEEFELLPPEKDAPEVGIIDSGIMEGHKYLVSALNPHNSKSYIKEDTSTADMVKGGGHGTRIAGAILYPQGISTNNSPYQLPCFVRNLRVLDENCCLAHTYPAALMREIIEEQSECTIFNLSINSRVPYRPKHMSSWAAMIDTLTHEKEVLFVISAGNIPKDIIEDYHSNGFAYPLYLHERFCRLANPAQSSFGLVVGSLNHADYEDGYRESIGGIQDVSAFSRIGMGIWGEIKPDVVEYGGGMIISKDGLNLVNYNEVTSPELLRSTLHGGSAIGKDRVGTSFAAPKVAHIASQLLKLYPDEGVNLLRAMIVQGARLPKDYFEQPTKESIQYFGYGLPSIERVTRNTDQRITFYNVGQIKVDEGHIYSLSIPESIRNQADEYEILIEVTLAYTAKVRRTRQKTKSYLATWLDWTSSKMDESLINFKEYVLKEIEGTDTQYDKDVRDQLDGFKWKIRERSNWGTVKDIRRNDSTVQKDWVTLKSFELPEELCFAVRAHKGWDRNYEEVPYALVVSIEVLDADLPIYEAIRIENDIEIPIDV
jgi:hypothetical protein